MSERYEQHMQKALRDRAAEAEYYAERVTKYKGEVARYIEDIVIASHNARNAIEARESLQEEWDEYQKAKEADNGKANRTVLPDVQVSDTRRG